MGPRWLGWANICGVILRFHRKVREGLHRCIGVAGTRVRSRPRARAEVIGSTSHCFGNSEAQVSSRASLHHIRRLPVGERCSFGLIPEGKATQSEALHAPSRLSRARRLPNRSNATEVVPGGPCLGTGFCTNLEHIKGAKSAVLVNPMHRHLDFPYFKALIASAAIGLMCGCSGTFAPSAIQPNETPIGNIQGSVHGGQAPVTGAHIYLYAAGTGGYGTSATSLIKSATNTFEDGSGNYYVVTDSNGNFALGGDYTCTEGTQVYMVAVGGNPGLTGVVNNTAIVQMAGLGQCPAAGNLAAQVPYLVINEVTTVAFAYSMGGFGSTAFNISSNAANSPAAATAIANAMANAGNIVNLQYGQAPVTVNGNTNSVNPQQKIYALANILAACVNTSGPTSSGCTSLFNAAKSSVRVTATDEANAIFNIVHNPANTSTNATLVNSIWNLTPVTPVFSPSLTAIPADWTMPVIYNNLVSQPGTNGSNQIISGPYNIAFDANGNAWIGDRQKGVVEVGPQGATHTYNAGFGMVKGVAVSPADGTIWVSDYGDSIVDVLDTSGNVTQTVTANIKNNGPILTAFALDGAGGYLAYQANEDTPGIVLFDASATTYTKIKYEKGTSGFPNIDTPGWIAVDQTGQAWLPSTDTADVGNWTVALKNGA